MTIDIETRAGIHVVRIVGDISGPVLTIKTDAIPAAIAKSWNLYRSEYGWQIFTYSCSSESYEAFAEEFVACR